MKNCFWNITDDIYFSFNLILIAEDEILSMKNKIKEFYAIVSSDKLKIFKVQSYQRISKFKFWRFINLY